MSSFAGSFGEIHSLATCIMLLVAIRGVGSDLTVQTHVGRGAGQDVDGAGALGAIFRGRGWLLIAVGDGSNVRTGCGSHRSSAPEPEPEEVKAAADRTRQALASAYL